MTRRKKILIFSVSLVVSLGIGLYFTYMAAKDVWLKEEPGMEGLAAAVGFTIFGLPAFLLVLIFSVLLVKSLKK